MAQKIEQFLIDKAYARLKFQIFQEIRKIFRAQQNEHNLSQQDIADKLGIDKALISKRLNGEKNLTLKTVAELFIAMDARLEVKGVSHAEIAQAVKNKDIKTSGYEADNVVSLSSVCGQTLSITGYGSKYEQPDVDTLTTMESIN